MENERVSGKMQIEPAIAILIGAALATVGWLYTGRRARTLARKQHTINVMLQASFNREYGQSFNVMVPHLKSRKCPDFSNDQNEDVRAQFRTVMNHYEFIAAGLRNGDFDERLIRDSERATLVIIFETTEKYIYALRDSRQRQSIYEHLEWLHNRWTKNQPGWFWRTIEYCRGRPMAGRRAKVS